MIKFVAVLVISTVVCEGSILRESCSTTGVKEGFCVNLRECPSICSMSTDFDTPMTVERLKYLIESLCGYSKENKTPKVCCPAEEVMILKTEEMTTLSAQTTDSLQNRDEMMTPNQIGEETTASNEI